MLRPGGRPSVKKEKEQMGKKGKGGGGGRILWYMHLNISTLTFLPGFCFRIDKTVPDLQVCWESKPNADGGTW